MKHFPIRTSNEHVQNAVIRSSNELRCGREASDVSLRNSLIEKKGTVGIMPQWLIDLFQPIWTVIMSLLVWLGIVSPHQEASSVVAPSVVAEHVVAENELQVEKSSEVSAPSNE
jgi:hypothetical protein